MKNLENIERISHLLDGKEAKEPVDVVKLSVNKMEAEIDSGTENGRFEDPNMRNVWEVFDDCFPQAAKSFNSDSVYGKAQSTLANMVEPAFRKAGWKGEIRNWLCGDAATIKKIFRGILESPEGRQALEDLRNGSTESEPK